MTFAAIFAVLGVFFLFDGMWRVLIGGRALTPVESIVLGGVLLLLAAAQSWKQARPVEEPSEK